MRIDDIFYTMYNKTDNVWNPYYCQFLVEHHVE